MHKTLHLKSIHWMVQNRIDCYLVIKIRLNKGGTVNIVDQYFRDSGENEYAT